MMDFNERVIPNISANFLYREALARYEFAQKIIKKKKQKHVKILDLGCGTGYGSALLTQNGSVVAMDKEKQAILYARKHYIKGPEFKLGDVESFAVYLGQFDVICAFEIIEHLKRPRAFLKNIYKLLRKDGFVILSTPNNTFVSPYAKNKSPYHVKEYKKREFEKLLKSFFTSVTLYGQIKNKNAKKALDKFMESQEKRQELVNKDTWGIRTVLPKNIKEKVWKYVGGFYGRRPQDSLKTRDFPIKESFKENAEYFIAVCKK